MDPAQMRTKATGTPLGQLAEGYWAGLAEQSELVYEGHRHSAADLGAQSRRVSTGLRRLGVMPGDRVVVCMANCPEVGVSYHAIWRAGAVATPVLFLLSEDELRHVLRDSGARVVITTPEFLPKVAAAAAETQPTIVVAGDAPEGVVPFNRLADEDESGLISVAPSELAALLYTGGTTGRAKGVMVSHNALSAAAWAGFVGGVELGQTVSLLPLPLAHVYGLMVSTIPLHSVEPGKSVLMRWFDPAGFLMLAASERVQLTTVVPTMLRLLLDQPIEQYDLGALERMVSGSAPLPAEVRDRLAARLPHVEIVEGYGCTETAALTSSTPRGQGRSGSVGRAAHGVEIRIEGPSGATAAPGDDGEICVRGPMLMDGYWHAPDETAYALRDGWFHTGDVGRVDADGYLYIVDRIKDVILRGGFNVYPRDVEEALMGHPDVANCAVIGRPDEARGEEVVAFVQLRPGATTTADELREFARTHLSAVKYPREIHLIDQVPLTSVGKLDRKALRAVV